MEIYTSSSDSGERLTVPCIARSINLGADPTYAKSKADRLSIIAFNVASSPYEQAQVTARNVDNCSVSDDVDSVVFTFMTRNGIYTSGLFCLSDISHEILYCSRIRIN